MSANIKYPEMRSMGINLIEPSVNNPVSIPENPTYHDSCSLNIINPALINVANAKISKMTYRFTV